MSYSSTFTSHTPGGFNLDHPNRFIDVAYDPLNPDDIRLTITTTTHTAWENYEDKFEDHPTHAEARELATRLLIAIGTPHHIVKELLEIQDTAGTPKETY